MLSGASLTVSARDKAGNLSTKTETWFIIDTVPPVVTLNSTDVINSQNQWSYSLWNLFHRWWWCFYDCWDKWYKFSSSCTASWTWICLDLLFQLCFWLNYTVKNKSNGRFMKFNNDIRCASKRYQMTWFNCFSFWLSLPESTIEPYFRNEWILSHC